MPHFLAIAIYRIDEYAAANIPVLPLQKGMLRTKIHMLLYTIAFLIAAPLLTLFGYTGWVYLTIALGLSGFWVVLCIQGFFYKDVKVWARKVFAFSLVLITALMLAIIII